MAARQELEKLEETTSRDAPSRERSRARERRRSAALAALVQMKGRLGPVVSADDGPLDFLAIEVSEHMVQELARRWSVLKKGYPTSLELAALAETIHVETAVAALDGQEFASALSRA